MLNFPKRQKKAIDSQINIVPYIDVMLVLLIIFMMTTPIIEQGIEVDLPSSAAGEIVDFSDDYPVIISIDKLGKYYINNLDSDIDKNQKVKLNVLVAIIKGRLAVNKNKKIFIRADKSVRYEFIVNLMSYLQVNDVPKVGLITDTINKKTIK